PDGDVESSSHGPPSGHYVTPVLFGVTSPVCTPEQKVPTETFSDVHCVPTVQRGVVRVTTGLTPHPSGSPGWWHWRAHRFVREGGWGYEVTTFPAAAAAAAPHTR